MESVVPVLLGAVAALLVAILVELSRIRSLLSRLPPRSGEHTEPSEGRSTVTVNVGALPAAEGPPVTVVEEPAATEPAPEPPPPAEPEEAPPMPEVEPPARRSFFSGPKPGSGQLGAVECPHCGAENSSFRTECFRCAKKL